MPPVEYTADYTLLQSVPAKARRISTSLIYFFSAVVVTSKNVQGLCSYTLLFFARFLQLIEIDANKILWKKIYLPLIKKSEYFLL